MAFGIYKPGQGYWVRVLTAALAGVMVLALAAWSWTQVGAIRLPRPVWEVTLQPAGGRAIPDQEVRLLRASPDNPGELVPIGRARVRSVVDSGTGSMRLEIDDIAMTANLTPADAHRVEAVEQQVDALSGTIVGLPQGRPIVEPVLLQAAVASLILLGGAILIYWLVGVRPSTAEFLIATDGEMKKVNWSTRRDIIASTQVVILWTVLIAAGLYVVDLAFSTFFRLIGVLQQ